ncbi:GNAT family N-acetyltransferase [Nesterenkonia alba]|uniref:GNAT family N-acetyltransferase n=1 Tax=Nesterenkonia alba TaxID=515814 RepID=UPI0003B671DD|nr:GNAT family N-acetyltransferase [Nesterenkonia alba]
MSTTDQVHPSEESSDFLAEETPAASPAPCLTLDSGLTVRPWQDGDDLRLMEVWGDADDRQIEQDRAMLRPSSNDPWQRTVIAEEHEVPVAAATVVSSALHPTRLWFYAEVLPEHRRKGVAAQLLNILEAEMSNCSVQSLKARCAKGSAAQCFLKDNGFTKIQRSRDVVVAPGVLPIPDIENSPMDLEDLATGSVELSEVVAQFYNAVHHWDPAEMTIGTAQKYLLAPETGASGAVVLRDTSHQNRITAFAVSYTSEQTDAPADVLLGWNPQLAEHEAASAVSTLLALVAARYPVQLEVDDAMTPLTGIIDDLVERDEAEVDFEALIYARDQSA